MKTETAEDSKKRSSKDEEALLARIRKRFHVGLSAETLMRSEAKDDDEFEAGTNQWLGNSKADREAQGRPALQINKLPQFVKQVTNEMRQNRPQIRALPVSDDADIETAKKLTGLMRHIQNLSMADLAYDHSGEQMVIGGYGYYRIRTDYVGDDTFDQECLIDRIQSRFSVVLDPNFKQLDASDIKWGFIFEDVTKEDFEDMYPDAAAVSFDFKSEGEIYQNWVTEGTIKIAEYFEVREENEILYLTTDGRKIWEDNLEESGVTQDQIASKRTVKKPCVYWYKTNGLEILEDEIELPGPLIPIVGVFGEEKVINGKRVYKGLIRDAKDPQRMVNYWWTSYTENVALAPLAPFIGYEGQFVDPQLWANANTQPVPYLEARWSTDATNGQQMPLPQRQQFAGVPSGIDQGLTMATNALKETTGMYNESLGAQSNANSGKAINARKQEGDTATFHFSDNVVRAQRHAGRILLQYIPHVYDSARVQRIIGEDGTAEMLPINGHPGNDPEKPLESDDIYDFTVGRYDIVIDSGPSYQTKRQEASQSLLEYFGKNEAAAQLLGDLFLSQQDWPLAKEAAARLKMMLPPQILQAENGKMPPQVQQALSGMQNQLQQTTQQLHEAMGKLQDKQAEMSMKVTIADKDNATKLEIAKLNNSPPEAIQQLVQEVLFMRQGLSQMVQHLGLTPPNSGPDMSNPNSVQAPQAPAQGASVPGQPSASQPSG